MTRLAALHARITGDASGFVKAAQKAGEAAQKAGGRIGAGTGAGLAGALGAARKGIDKMSGSTGMRMLPVQLSQVAQQAAAGTNVMRALSIQAADIGLAFGTVGAIAGTLATVAMPTIIAAFSDAGDEADRFTKSLEDLQDMQGRLEGTLKILDMSMEELVETYGVAAERVRLFAADLAQVQYQQAISRLNEYQIAIEDVGAAFVRQARQGGPSAAAAREYAESLGLTLAEAQELIVALENLQEAQGIDAQIAAGQALKEVMERLNVDADDLDENLLAIQEALLMAGIQGAEFERVMAEVRDRAKETADSLNGINIAGGRSAGPGGPMTDAERGQAAGVYATDEEVEDGDGSGRTRGLRTQEQFERDLERLQEQLSTELELEKELYDERQKMLNEALERELLTQEEYDELMERERKRHQEKMAQIDAVKYGSALQATESFMGDMAGALMQGNEEMVRIGKAFGAAEALINAWRTFGQVMADPSLPWYKKLPVALGLFGQAIQAVSAIQGAGKGGSGRKALGNGGGGGGGQENAGQIEGEAQSPSLTRSLTVIGDRFNRAQAIEIAEFMNEGTDDGLVIRGRR